MNILKNKKWQISENLVTDEKKYLINRRQLGLGGIYSCVFGLGDFNKLKSKEINFSKDKNNFRENLSYKEVINRKITPEAIATKYNNFYEFGTSKQIWKASRKLQTRPWTISISGEVDRELTLDIDDLLSRVQLEERVYRFRCVEAWSMVVPWIGFELSNFLKIAKPKNSAKYISFETFYNPSIARGQKQDWYPWPYLEAITIEEALNELAFLAVGIYGKPLPNQNGSPIRLVIPWKYGFKSIKSIVKIKFLPKRPKTFWEIIVPKEYGFWANVNPRVRHPRWNQNTERDLGTGERIPTKLFNGYGPWVAHMYKKIESRELYI